MAGDLLDVHVLAVSQGEDDPLPRGEGVDEFGQVGQGVGRDGFVLGGRPGRDRFAVEVVEGDEPSAGHPLGLPPVVDRAIHADSVQPGRKAGPEIGVEGVQPGVSLDESLLGDILGVLGRSHVAQGQAEDPAVMPLVELPERFFVTPLGKDHGMCFVHSCVLMPFTMQDSCQRHFPWRESNNM